MFDRRSICNDTEHPIQRRNMKASNAIHCSRPTWKYTLSSSCVWY